MIEQLDLRRLPPERVAAGLVEWQQQGPLPVLVMTNCPLRRMLPEGFCWWPLVDGPSAYFFLGHRVEPRQPLLEPMRRQHKRLDGLYRQAVNQARNGQAECVRVGADFCRLLRRHLDFEEGHLYPLYLATVGEQRSLRELGYEHRGIREGLERFEPFLAEVLDGRLTSKQIDAYDIDFFHLLEHHVKREEDGLYPVLEALAPRECGELLEPGPAEA